jgi:hypothetical protein
MSFTGVTPATVTASAAATNTADISVLQTDVTGHTADIGTKAASSDVYTKTETYSQTEIDSLTSLGYSDSEINALLAAKAGSSTVTALQGQVTSTAAVAAANSIAVTARPTQTQVTSQITAANIFQDLTLMSALASQSSMTAAQSDIAALQAQDVTHSGALTAVNSNIAGLFSGSMALQELNVEWPGIPQDNISKAKHKSGANTWSTVEQFHSHDASGTLCQFRHWDSRWSTNPVTSLSLSYYGALNTCSVASHGSFSVNGSVTAVGDVSCGGDITASTVSCQNLTVSGVAILPSSSPAIGTPLKQTMLSASDLSWGTTNTSPGGTTNCFSYSYTPTSASTELHMSVSTGRVYVGGSGSDGWYTLRMYADSSHVGHKAILFTGDRNQSHLMGVMLAKHTVTSTAAITLQLRASAAGNASTDDTLVVESGGITAYLIITEVQR